MLTLTTQGISLADPSREISANITMIPYNIAYGYWLQSLIDFQLKYLTISMATSYIAVLISFAVQPHWPECRVFLKSVKRTLLLTSVRVGETSTL